MNYIRLLSISQFILLFILLGISHKTKGQSLDFGIKGGVNISSHLNNFRYADGDIELNLRPNITTDYQAGFIIRKDFSRIFRLQAEPSVIMLGAKYEEKFMLRGFELQTESKTELLYFQLPLLFQFSTNTVPKSVMVHGRDKATTTYHISGGIFGDYLLDARFSGTNTGAPIGISFESNFSNDVTSQYSKYNGGAIFGIGFEYGERRKIGFETRALYSVFDSGNASESFFTPQNMAVTFSVYLLM